MTPSSESAADNRDKVVWRDLGDTYRPRMRRLEDFLADVTLKQSLSVAGVPLIFIEERVLAQLLDDCRVDVKREHGGILLGEVFEDPGGRYFVVVRASLLAPHTAGSSVHLQFSEASWESLWEQMGTLPECVMVGWYHTHPNLGVFLSGTDRRTQELYFSQPWQIAVVIDPVKEQIGFFHGREGRSAGDVRAFSIGKAALPVPGAVRLESAE